MSKRIVSVLMMVLLAGFAGMAHAEWVSYDGQGVARPELQVRQLADNLTRLDISLSGIDTETVSVEGQDYTQVRIPGHWWTVDEGNPELPFITSRLIIPNAGTPVVKVVDATWREIAADPVVPSKGNLTRDVDPATVPYTFGPVYSQGGVFPATEARLADPFIMRDYRGVSLRINAVRWDADRGVLLALESATLEVETTGTGGINVKQARFSDGIDAQFANLYALGFDNFDTASKYSMVATEGRMLIVCNDAFMGIIQPFVEWKRQTGLDVTLISSGSVGGTTAGIQGAIDGMYAEPEGLTYVVLVGDQAQIPSYSGTYEGADDDTRYANQEGNDLYPDLFVSRISGSNPSDIQTQINKFIHYERNPEAGADWYHVGAGLASSEGSPPDYERANWLRDDLLGYTFTEVHQIYQPSGNAAQISAAVNEGVSIVNYIGHGSGSSWSNPYFNISNVQALSNGWRTPWIIDVSCSNGDFSMTECFAEAWMRAGDPAQPDGAVAMYSSSTSTPWVPPCVMQAEAVDLLVADQANVIGSLYYHGIMQVLDEYPGSQGTQLVEQYNIFGDCSLMVRTDTPIVPTMDHADVVDLGSTVFPVDTGVRGAKVALYSSAGLHGVGVTDVDGHVDLQLDNPVTEPGEVTLTVTGYNLLTEIATLQAVVPVAVDIQPASIPVGETTEVTVTLMDPPAAKTTVGVNVTIEGFGVEGLSAVTDENGVAVFSVTPEYGETLTVAGREPGASYDMFAEGLAVTGAMDLTGVVVSAEVASIGLVDALTPHIEGTVTVTSDVADFDLALVGCGLDQVTAGSGNSIMEYVTPTSTGSVTATLLKSGYNVIQSGIDVVAAYGTLAGTVTDADNGNAPLSGVRVYGFNAGDDPTGEPLFDLTTDAEGAFAVSEELLVGDYDLYAEIFGYLNHAETYFLMFGENDHAIAMNLAPAGVLSGTVTALEGGAPIEASIKVRRSDNAELVATVVCDENGYFETPALTYFNYDVVVTAYQFIPQTVSVGIDAPSVVKNFEMEATNGNILVIDDNSVREEFVNVAPKLGKGDVVIAEGYTAPPARAAADLVADLEAIGYTVEMINSSASNYADWITYDLVVVSAGAKTADLSSALMADMTSFMAAGGKLLIEGGEVAYNHQNDAAFCADVLHISDWHTDNAGDLDVADAGHYVMSVPNTVTGPVDLTYVGYGDSDAVAPAADAQMPGNWTSYSTYASVVTYDTNPAPQGGQMVFFSFNYSAVAAPARAELLQNAVVYLLTPEFGNSSLSGTVLCGGGENSGVTLTLTPGNEQFVTGPDGSFEFEGLFAGEYHLTAVKDGWSTGVADLVLTEGEHKVQDFVLNQIVSNAVCDEPGVDIPDNDPEGGVYVSIDVPFGSTVSDLAVYVDISHTFIGDLEIVLISPSGTEVMLHNNQGLDDDDIVGWYPTELNSYEDMDALLGEEMQGVWQLHVTDHGPWDTGVINSWCLNFTYEENALSAAGDETPDVLALEGNYPNPFNPMTVIKFAVPSAGNVELAVYDVRGVKIRTLVSETMEPGSHEVTWMGRDDSGRGVASGTYFYRISSGGQSVVGKMLLMK